MKLINLLRDLVEIHSESGKEDEIVDYVTEFLEDLGYSPKVEEKRVKNVVLEGKGDLWLITHLDTTRKLTDFSFDGVYCYGTGVCDAKASVAAILSAIEESEEFVLNVAFLSDEEEGGRGSEHFARRRKGRAIIMEPTELKVAEAQYGSAEISVKVKGKPSHGAFPDFGVSAIEKAYELYEKVKNIWRGFSIQEIRGGDDSYSIPEECFIRFAFVFPPEIRSKDVLEKVLKIAENYGEVEVVEYWDGFYCDEIVELARIIEEKTVMKSWTDAANLKAEGWKVTVWGPGELEYCHTKYERVKLVEVEKAKEIIRRINESIQSSF